MMPEKMGMNLVVDSKNKMGIPVLLLSALNEVDDKITALI